MVQNYWLPKSKDFFSPPARWGLLDFIRVVLLLRLLLLLRLWACLHQLPPPLPPCQLFAKLFANFPAQCALLDLNLGPSQLSAHRWASTWDLPSSVRTAGPQPGTFPAQVHGWTSTWDLPSSVRTAGPKPGTFPAQCAPLDLNGQIECQKICQIKCQKICQIECQKICQIEC